MRRRLPVCVSRTGVQRRPAAPTSASRYPNALLRVQPLPPLSLSAATAAIQLSKVHSPNPRCPAQAHMRSTGHASMRRDAAALVEEFAAFYLPGALERPRGAEDSEDDSDEDDVAEALAHVRLDGHTAEPGGAPAAQGLTRADAFRAARAARAGQAAAGGRARPAAGTPAQRLAARGLGTAPPPPPPPPFRTKWTRRVPHPVLIGHAASLSQVPGRGPPSCGGSRGEPRSQGRPTATRAAARTPRRSARCAARRRAPADLLGPQKWGYESRRSCALPRPARV